MLSEGLLVAFNSPKREDQGEDADPLRCEVDGTQWVGVFDGMGGAGASSYETADGMRSGAYLASRLAASLCEKWAFGEAGRTIGGDRKHGLHEVLARGLAAEQQTRAPSKSRIRGRLLKALPTTVALAGIRNRGDGEVDCNVLWAGDSRVYFVQPARGLVQLSVDHLEQSLDAQDNLRGDDALSNFVSADHPFFIEELWAKLSVPVLVIAATDGCFGYVYSPAHFEMLLLSTLARSRDPDEWTMNLRSEITSIGGDDASIAVLQYGWNSFDELRDSFHSRIGIVAPLVAELDAARERTKVAEDALQAAEQELAATRSCHWQTYRLSYESEFTTSRWPT